MPLLVRRQGQLSAQCRPDEVALPFSNLLHAGKAREKACLQTLTVLHVPGDPLQKDDLDTKLDMRRSASYMPQIFFQF